MPQEPDAGHLAQVDHRTGSQEWECASDRAVSKEVEINRLAALAGLPPIALKALKQGRLTLKQARMIARLSDKKAQAEYARQAMDGYLYDWNLQQSVSGQGIDVTAPAFALVGKERYLAAGGQIESDLFGELPDRLLDVDILKAAWRVRAQPIVDALKEAGLSVYLADAQVYAAPEGFVSLGYVNRSGLSRKHAAAVKTAEKACEEAAEPLADADLAAEDIQAAITAALMAELEMTKVLHPDREIGAVMLWPDADCGVDGKFAASPVQVRVEDIEDDEGDDEGGNPDVDAYDALPKGRIRDVETPAIEVEVDGRSHVLHELYTDVATRGLVRDLADSPQAALTAIIAQMFKQVALSLGYDKAALTVKATRYGPPGFPPIPSLKGEVRARLQARRDAYLASGLRPIPWVDGLPHGEKMALLAELVAVSLDLREARTNKVEAGARVEAAEIADLCGADISAHWSPDEEFLKVHSKKQLLALLEEMDEDDAQAKGLKKDDLVAYVAEQAAAHRFAPEALSWRLPVATAPEPDAPAEGGEGAASPAQVSEGDEALDIAA